MATMRIMEEKEKEKKEKRRKGRTQTLKGCRLEEEKSTTGNRQEEDVFLFTQNCRKAVTTSWLQKSSNYCPRTKSGPETHTGCLFLLQKGQKKVPSHQAGTARSYRLWFFVSPSGPKQIVWNLLKVDVPAVRVRSAEGDRRGTQNCKLLIPVEGNF